MAPSPAGNIIIHRTIGRGRILIDKRRLNRYSRRIIQGVAVNKDAITGKMEIVVFIQPYMAVNARAFVKPPFVLGSVDAYSNYVVPVEIQVIRYIVRHPAIAAGVVAEVDAVDPYLTVAEDAVELYFKTLAGIPAAPR